MPDDDMAFAVLGPEGAMDPEVARRAREWGATAIALLQEHGMLATHDAAGGKVVPVDADGHVPGVFVPLCDPGVTALVTMLLDQYLTRAGAALQAEKDKAGVSD